MYNSQKQISRNHSRVATMVRSSFSDCVESFLLYSVAIFVGTAWIPTRPRFWRTIQNQRAERRRPATEEIFACDVHAQKYIISWTSCVKSRVIMLKLARTIPTCHRGRFANVDRLNYHDENTTSSCVEQTTPCHNNSLRHEWQDESVC